MDISLCCWLPSANESFGCKSKALDIDVYETIRVPVTGAVRWVVSDKALSGLAAGQFGPADGDVKISGNGSRVIFGR